MKVKYKISDIFDLQMGKTPSRDEHSFWNSNDYKWVAISDLDDCKYIENTSEYISSQAVQNTGIKIVPKNTVIMSFKLSIGKVAITKEDIYTNEAIMAFFNKGIVNLELSYLYYLLKSYKWDLLAQRAAKGKSLNKEILNNATLCFHNDIQTQKEIVAVLDKVTSLIKMRKEQLEKLDILVKSKFIEMFGDPVLNPKGWEKKKGNILFNFTNGRFLSSSYRTQSGVPVFGGNGIAWYTNEAFIFFPTIIIGRVGENCGNIHYSNKPIWVTDNAIYISKFLHNIFNLIYLSYEMNLLNFRSKAEGGGQPKITQKILNDCFYRTPPLDLQNQFAEFVEHVEKNKENIKSSLNQLETLYSALMQEYFG